MYEKVNQWYINCLYLQCIDISFVYIHSVEVFQTEYHVWMTGNQLRLAYVSNFLNNFVFYLDYIKELWYIYH